MDFTDELRTLRAEAEALARHIQALQATLDSLEALGDDALRNSLDALEAELDGTAPAAEKVAPVDTRAQDRVNVAMAMRELTRDNPAFTTKQVRDWLDERGLTGADYATTWLYQQANKEGSGVRSEAQRGVYSFRRDDLDGRGDSEEEAA